VARRREIRESSGYTILVIDDQEEILTTVRLLLERDGHKVLTALSGEEGLHTFHQEKIHLVIVDYFMPQMTGEDVIREIRKTNKDVHILLQTGYAGEKPPLETLRALDIQGYHSKTDGPEHLLLWVEASLKAAAHIEEVCATERLKAELLVKQDFLANISHEMRSRLHIILGYSDLLLADPQSETLAEHLQQPLETIQRHGRSLWGLANNFLNFVKLNAEAMRISLQSFSLEDLRQELREEMTFLLRNKSVAFLWEADPQLPPLWADREKLAIILQNLLRNAVKFTETGEIRLTAAFSAADNSIHIHITDTGIGIDPAYHETIFESFQQATNPTVRTALYAEGMGIGIGLTLARKLARLMGGDLTVASEIGTGAIFTLTLRAPAEVMQGNNTPALVDSSGEGNQFSPAILASQSRQLLTL
jgi:signal transduction histidine kinase